uniref:Uncharacterized protein n=1 Tax=Physcomitrium patens TaxID=3218 RepID=A0A2K1JZH5_PHYPA|nr:hypothetical protein PHYPA_014040 [Physcomitrium patens]
MHPIPGHLQLCNYAHDAAILPDGVVGCAQKMKNARRRFQYLSLAPSFPIARESCLSIWW